MNTVLVVIASAFAAGAATFSVITVQRPDPAVANTELVALTRQIAEQQHLIRSNIDTIAEVQREMLRRDEQSTATIQRQVDRSKSFFERNMDIPSGTR